MKWSDFFLFSWLVSEDENEQLQRENEALRARLIQQDLDEQKADDNDDWQYMDDQDSDEDQYWDNQAGE